MTHTGSFLLNEDELVNIYILFIYLFDYFILDPSLSLPTFSFFVRGRSARLKIVVLWNVDKLVE